MQGGRVTLFAMSSLLACLSNVTDLDEKVKNFSHFRKIWHIPDRPDCAVIYLVQLQVHCQVCVGQVRIVQVRIAQVRKAQVHTTRVHTARVRTSQIRISQVRTIQVRTGSCVQFRYAPPGSHRSGRPGQVRPGQIRITQVRPAQFCKRFDISFSACSLSLFL